MKMKKSAKILILLTMAVIWGIVNTGTSIQAAGQELNVLTWCDHTDPALLRPFEEKHKVRY